MLRLMVIFYLQRVVNPPIIPCLAKLVDDSEPKKLTKMYRYKPKGNLEIDYLNYAFEQDHQKLDQLMKEKYSSNTSNVVTLLEGFFHYYSVEYHNLPENKKTISIDCGDIIETAEEARGNLFVIQDAFDPKMFLGSGMNLKQEGGLRRSKKVMKEFIDACSHLLQGELNKIFEKVPENES